MAELSQAFVVAAGSTPKPGPRAGNASGKRLTGATTPPFNAVWEHDHLIEFVDWDAAGPACRDWTSPTPHSPGHRYIRATSSSHKDSPTSPTDPDDCTSSSTPTATPDLLDTAPQPSA